MLFACAKQECVNHEEELSTDRDMQRVSIGFATSKQKSAIHRPGLFASGPRSMSDARCHESLPPLSRVWLGNSSPDRHVADGASSICRFVDNRADRNFSARNIVRWKAAVLLPRTIFAALQQSIRFNKIIVSASLALARMPWRFNAWISR
jgi:hypothetical protein